MIIKLSDLREIQELVSNAFPNTSKCEVSVLSCDGNEFIKITIVIDGQVSYFHRFIHNMGDWCQIIPNAVARNAIEFFESTGITKVRK